MRINQNTYRGPNDTMPTKYIYGLILSVESSAISGPPESPLHESFPDSPPAQICLEFNVIWADVLYTLLQRLKLNPSISSFNFTSLLDAVNHV